MQGMPAFEVFVPSKFRVIAAVPVPVVEVATASEAKYKLNSRLAAFFHQQNADSLAPAVVKRADTKAVELLDSNAAINAKKFAGRNQPSISRCPFGRSPFQPKLLTKLDIEANFNLQPLLLGNEISFVPKSFNLPQSAGKSDISLIRNKLMKWADKQCSWVYPDRPVSALSMKINDSGFGSAGAELALHNYWQEPSVDDISNISMIKSRRLKWQAALCSALDKLLLHTNIDGEEMNQEFASKGVMDSFYVLGSDADSADNRGSKTTDKDKNNPELQQAAKSILISAIFFRDRIADDADTNQHGEFSVLNSRRALKLNRNTEGSIKKDTVKDRENDLENKVENEGENVSCILTGAKKSLINRLIDLGVDPMEMVDEIEANTRKSDDIRKKEANRHISSAGRTEAFSAGKVILLRGSYALRVAADCLAETVFSTAKSSKFYYDVPKIISRCPFTQGVRTPLHASVMQCSHNFLSSNAKQRSKVQFSNGQDKVNNKGDNNGDTEKRNNRAIPTGDLSRADSRIGSRVGSRVPNPSHRILLTGAIHSDVLSSLAELLCALSLTRDSDRKSKEGEKGEKNERNDRNEGRGKGGKNTVISIADGQTIRGWGENTKDFNGSSDNSDIAIAKFEFSMLERLDSAFMHTNRQSEKDDLKGVEENDPQNNPQRADSVPPVSSVPEVKRPLMPFVFLTRKKEEKKEEKKENMVNKEEDILMSNEDYLPGGKESSWEYSGESSGVLSRSIKAGNAKNGDYRESENEDNNDEDEEDDYFPNGVSWVESRRTRDAPYFVVRTTSSKINSFSYFHSCYDRDGDYNGWNNNFSSSGNNDDSSWSSSGGSSSNSNDNSGGNTNNNSSASSNVDEQTMKSIRYEEAMKSIRYEETMKSIRYEETMKSVRYEETMKSIRLDSYFPIEEIRWFRSSGNNILNHLNSGIDDITRKRKRFLDTNGATGEEFDSQANTNDSTHKNSAGNCGDNRGEPCYEVVRGVKPPAGILSKLRHSSAVDESLLGEDIVGAVLKPLNAYEIYAPETLEDRERKRLS